MFLILRGKNALERDKASQPEFCILRESVESRNRPPKSSPNLTPKKPSRTTTTTAPNRGRRVRLAARNRLAAGQGERCFKSSNSSSMAVDSSSPAANES